MNYFRAIQRFWWIALFGAAMAGLTGLLLTYHVDRAWPLKFSKRAQPTFTAATELLVDSPSGPYLRTVTKLPSTPVGRAQKPAKGATTTTTTSTSPAAAPVVDTKPLIDAANLFPLFVESDAVVRIRTKLIGNIPGAVSARGLYSLQGAARFRPSVIPVMEISAVAPKPKYAIALVDGTARAFDIWLGRQQQRANIPDSQRIIVRELHVPQNAIATGGSSYGLPAIASFAVLALFIGLAVLLDQRLVPATRVRPVHVVEGAAAPMPTEPVERGGVAAYGGGPEQTSA
jgi:hypothetical protein